MGLSVGTASFNLEALSEIIVALGFILRWLQRLLPSVHSWVKILALHLIEDLMMELISLTIDLEAFSPLRL
jgi:uncharacterized protein involved in cysteine biosynthesis